MRRYIIANLLLGNVTGRFPERENSFFLISSHDALDNGHPAKLLSNYKSLLLRNYDCVVNEIGENETRGSLNQYHYLPSLSTLDHLHTFPSRLLAHTLTLTRVALELIDA